MQRRRFARRAYGPHDLVADAAILTSLLGLLDTRLASCSADRVPPDGEVVLLTIRSKRLASRLREALAENLLAGKSPEEDDPPADAGVATEWRFEAATTPWPL
jgi:hypothetical protein